MTTDTGRKRRLSNVGHYVHARVTEWQQGYLAIKSTYNAQAVASLAKLRRDVGRPLGSPGMWLEALDGVPIPEHYVDDKPTYGEVAAHTAFTLYALHQQSKQKPMHQPGQSFGTALRRLRKRAPDDGRAVRRRFEALGTATTLSEAVQHARGLISQLRSEGIPLDYGEFADQLVALQIPSKANGVRLAWGRDFYRVTSDETSDETNDEIEDELGEDGQ